MIKNTTRREYNRFVADETLEDYSLRYTPKSFRTFSELLIANTAVGSISFLALEVIGASIAIKYGFSTAFWAILTASLIIFFTAIPISYHAAKYNIDIDLITRSAGFGYVGSTFTSLIYASFSFIFFALEASIMAQALKLYFELPLAWGYLLSSLVIIPMVYRGISFINKLHFYTQPIWIIMMLAPFIAIVSKDPTTITTFMHLQGQVTQSNEFNLYYFGFAVGISLSLIAQIGEQVDYLRFMPPLTDKNRVKWWFSLLISGPGWIIIGFLKQMGGIFLAALVISSGLSIYEAKTPVEMYYLGYKYIFSNPEIALAAATFFVIISQIKINVTNAYAGSLAWSNFFSRLTHSHPGRVVWMVFNIGIALLLMELGLFDFLEKVLGMYSNVAIAWISTITADLLINKPLGLSPKIIEFKRAYLYNINPVGVGSMLIASVVSILSFIGLFGLYAQSYSALIAMLIAFCTSPLIAYLTKGKYYIARQNNIIDANETHHKCQICDNIYEKEDIAFCSLHNVKICSLCCSLDSLCHDSCKKHTENNLYKNIAKWVQKIFFHTVSLASALRIFNFFLLSSLMLFALFITFWMVYSSTTTLNVEETSHLKELFTNTFYLISIFVMLLVWLILLSHENRILVEKELEEKNNLIQKQKLKKAHLVQMIEQTHDSVISTDLDGYILTWNKGSELLYGYTEEEALGKHVSMLTPEESIDIFKKNLLTLKEKGSFSGDLRRITKQKKSIYVYLSLSLLKDEDGTPIAMVGYASDITKRVEIEKELQKHSNTLKYQAHYDLLTSLPNRTLFQDRLSQVLKQASRHKTLTALFFIDLDSFKFINDSFGHHIGDKVLQLVANKLQKSIRSEDTVSRLGGDEFTIIMTELAQTNHAGILAQKLIDSLAETFTIDGHSLHITLSIGIAFAPDDASELETLIMKADKAMYTAKKHGKNNFKYFSNI